MKNEQQDASSVEDLVHADNNQQMMPSQRIGTGNYKSAGRAGGKNLQLSSSPD